METVDFERAKELRALRTKLLEEVRLWTEDVTTSNKLCYAKGNKYLTFGVAIPTVAFSQLRTVVINALNQSIIDAETEFSNL